MVTTLSEIQEYLKKQDVEDPIPSKAVDRVTRSLAEGVKANTELPSGKCHGCSREVEVLFPIGMKICKACSEKFRKRGGELNIINTEFGQYCCDSCLKTVFNTWYVNPLICKYCRDKIGRYHKFNLVEMRKQLQKSRERIHKMGVETT